MDKIIDYSSPNHNDRPATAKIDILVIHYTGMPNTDEALHHMCNPNTGVSAHYLIDEYGQLFQLVSERKRAWHAGKSCWRGNCDINDRSIGIELANPGHEFGYQQFPTHQMNTLIKIAKEIIERHPISPRNVVGHSDIAPTRKRDPGELFDWYTLSTQGVGNWPESRKSKNRCKITGSNFEKALADYGYDTTDLSATITAFQRHFLPLNCGNQPDQKLFDKLEILTNNL